jgi:hypothetical protein
MQLVSLRRYYLTHEYSLETYTEFDIDMGSDSAIFIIITPSLADRRGVVLGGYSPW